MLDDLRRLTVALDKEVTLDAAARLGGFGKPVLLAWAADDRLFPLAISGSLPCVIDVVWKGRWRPMRRLGWVCGGRALGRSDPEGRGVRAPAQPRAPPPPGRRWPGSGVGEVGEVRVQRVLSPGGVESWTVIGRDHRPVPAIESYLTWLTRIERSPNTVRAYAGDLAAYWRFLEARGARWDQPSLDLLGEFTAWLRQPAENVVVLPTGTAARSTRTVNRMLSAIAGVYEFQARNGVAFARELVDERRSGRGSFKPFLHGLARATPRGRVGRLREQQRLPRTLELEQVAAIVRAQQRRRDRFLFALLALTGMRVGQALGLRHADVVSHERRIELMPRTDNANGARGKGSAGSVPITSALVRLHSDYMHEEYGDLDSDYVFVNLWGGRIGRPLTYATVDELVRRSRTRVGFFFTAHMLRHTFATMAARRGVPVEVLARLLCHRSTQTTSDTYLHATAEDLRAALERAGVLDELGAAL